jgi:hypothetical protein
MYINELGGPAFLFPCNANEKSNTSISNKTFGNSFRCEEKQNNSEAY